MFSFTTIWLAAACCAVASEPVTVSQSARAIPLVREVDIVVCGGSVSAVAAATEAAAAGADVLLVAPRTHVGDDLCSTLRLWLDPSEPKSGQLTKRIFADDERLTTPLHVKRTLESALLEAGVDFLLASFPTDTLRDPAGHVAGVVIANRAGRQAISAKVVIDATDSAIVAHLAGAEHWYYEATFPPCQRIVLGGKEPDSGAKPSRVVPAGMQVRGQDLSYYVYDSALPLGIREFARFAESEQLMRDMTHRAGQLRSSERIHYRPIYRIQGRRTLGATAPLLEDVEVCRPRGLDRLYVIGMAADLPRSRTNDFMPLSAQETLARRVGVAAAHEARGIVATGKPTVYARHKKASRSGGDIRETLGGLRPVGKTGAVVTAAAQAVPVWEDVDVVVIGGGTSGACAAIGAARRGAKVLVVEFQEGLGGVGTVGLIGKPYHGLDRGFTAQVPFPGKGVTTDDKMEWFRQQIRSQDGKIWFGAIGCGVYMEQERVRGAVVASPWGRGVVLARVVIDATGNADLAVAAGASSMYGGDSTRIALQGTGLPWRPLENSYVNTDYLLVDESDMIDMWRAFVGVRLAGETRDYDMGSFIQTRERRRVVGDHILSYLDQIAGRTYPDSVVYSGSDYDSHGYPSEPYFALIPHTQKTLKANHPAPGGTCYTPYRCMLPRGVEGMLVTGLGISMLRDASAMVRMQKDMHNQGYAAGVAAAMSADLNRVPRQIDVRELQKHLVEIGNLPSNVLTDVDSFPFPDARVQAAVEQLVDNSAKRDLRCRSLAIVLCHSQQALPMLQEAYSESSGAERLVYAKTLGFLGQKEGVPDLLAALAQEDAWDAKILQGKMAEYAHLPTPLDALILALGYSGDARALPAIIEWLERLDADVTLSHHRAVALALEKIGEPSAAEHLAGLLRKPGMRGHVMTRLEPLYNRDRERRRRTGPLREIVLARALYHCGDHEGLGESILHEYLLDIRGLFARHAQAVLDQNN